MMKTMKTIIFGGAFDPFHIGHAQIIKFLLSFCEDLKIYIIPCYISPSSKNIVASFDHRINMIRACLSDFDYDYNSNKNNKENIKICTIARDLNNHHEKHQPSLSYQIISALEKTYDLETDHCWWVIGQDQLENLPNWSNILTLVEKIGFIVIPRKTNILNHQLTDKYLDIDSLDLFTKVKRVMEKLNKNNNKNTQHSTVIEKSFKDYRYFHQHSLRFYCVNRHLSDVSSSLVRSKLTALIDTHRSCAIDKLITPSVRSYLQRYRIYQ